MSKGPRAVHRRKKLIERDIMMGFEKLEAYLDTLEAAYGIPACDCSVRHHRTEVFRHTAGYADIARSKPVSTNDLYFLYSATKVITCTAVMQLVERGRLGLEDAVDRYLPEFAHMQVLLDTPPEYMPIPWGGETAPAKNRIRIVDLMTMTAGLSYDLQAEPIVRLQKDSGNRATTREMIAAIAQCPLLFEPSTRYRYSLAHDVLAVVVEVVTGVSFSAYLQQNVFAPLGIHDMHFALTASNRDRLSEQYQVDPQSKHRTSIGRTNRFVLTERYESGGAGLISTVDAYAVFVDAMCCGGVGKNGARILTMESINQMRRNRLEGILLEDFHSRGKNGYGYGLGVRTLIDRSDSPSPLGEFGWDGAAGAYVLIDPEHELGIVYAQHVCGCADAYAFVHPTIRNLVYEALSL